MQAVVPLRPGDQLALRFELFSPRVKVETLGHVAWADSNGQAGISFADVPERLRRQIRDWVLMQMLSAAAISGRDSMFAPPAAELVLSAGLPAISLALEPEREMVRWGLISMSARSFGLFVDSVILICSVLIFSISAITAMGGVPPLALAGALLFAASAIFVAAYQLIFSEYLCGASPGKRLAAQASGSHLHFEERTVTRFR